MVGRSTAFMRRGPDVRAAAKTGTPSMETLRPTVPASVPLPADATGFSGDVSAQTVSGRSALDSAPDARQNPNATGAAAAAQEPLPTNATYQARPAKKSKKNKKQQQQQQQTQTTQATDAQQAAPAAAASPQQPKP